MTITFSIKLRSALVLFFAVATLAAKYTAGTPCGNYEQCDRKCWDGRWSVTQKYDDWGTLVCDPNRPDIPLDYMADCSYPDKWDQFGESPSWGAEVDVAKKACEEAGGAYCSSYCFLSGKRSGDVELKRLWEDSCTSNQGYGAHIHFSFTPNAVKDFFHCRDETVFGNVTKVVFGTSGFDS